MLGTPTVRQGLPESETSIVVVCACGCIVMRKLRFVPVVFTALFAWPIPVVDVNQFQKFYLAIKSNPQLLVSWRASLPSSTPKHAVHCMARTSRVTPIAPMNYHNFLIWIHIALLRRVRVLRCQSKCGSSVSRSRRVAIQRTATINSLT